MSASDFCGQASDCAGISQENGWFYTHSSAEVFDASDVTSWMKGLYWTENFVPRPVWGAQPPKANLTGYMDPLKMVGALGHHTASNRCFDQSDCKYRMQIFQENAFDRGMRYA